MSDPYLGEIRLFAGNFAPENWALCDGSSLQISSNTALYSLLGTNFGGDGVTTFKLPDLRGRVAVGVGQLTGGSNYTLAQIGGQETVSLTAGQLPTHQHSLIASTASATATNPSGNVLATPPANLPLYIPYVPGPTPAPGPTRVLNAAALQPSGGSQPHENRMPSTVITFIICTNGLYPNPN